MKRRILTSNGCPKYCGTGALAGRLPRVAWPLVGHVCDPLLARELHSRAGKEMGLDPTNKWALEYNSSARKGSRKPDSNEPQRTILNMDEEQRQLYQCVHGK